MPFIPLLDFTCGASACTGKTDRAKNAFKELQRQINRRMPGVAEDGIIGAQTLSATKRLLNNQTLAVGALAALADLYSGQIAKLPVTTLPVVPSMPSLPELVEPGLPELQEPSTGWGWWLFAGLGAAVGVGTLIYVKRQSRRSLRLSASGEERVGRSWASPVGRRWVDSQVQTPRGTFLLVKEEGRGSAILLEPGELEGEIARDIANLAFRSRERVEKLQQQEEEAYRDRHLLAFGERFTPIAAGKAISTLRRPAKFVDSSRTRQEFLEASVQQGWKVEQQRGKRVFVSPTGRYFLESDLTKTGMDYAEYLAKL
jgi:hypothetical protein